MLLFILLAIVSIVARVRSECPIVKVNGVNHEKHVLVPDIHFCYHIALDYDKDVLFYSYIRQFSEEPDDEGFEARYKYLKTNETGMITKVNGPYSFAIDRQNKTVYIGAQDGIYTFDYETKEATLFTAEDMSITQMFFKNKLYFIQEISEIAYYVDDDGNINKVPELDGIRVSVIALDKNDNIIFANETGLYCHKKETSKISQINDKGLQDITANFENDLYFTGYIAFFSIDDALNIKKVSPIRTGFAQALALDKDNNIMYSNHESIVILKPTDKKCPSRH